MFGFQHGENNNIRAIDCTVTLFLTLFGFQLHYIMKKRKSQYFTVWFYINSIAGITLPPGSSAQNSFSYA